MVAPTLALTLAALIVATIGTAAGLRAEEIRACARRKTGAIRLLPAGKSCKPSETPLTWSQAGPAGPAGPPGDAGAPGSALAFAHVASNGMLIAADSQNVTASSTAVGPGSAGATCLTVNAPRVRNAVVTLDINESGGPSGRTIYVALRPEAVDAYVSIGACPQGTNVVVYTLIDTTAATTEFYALFN